jgi:hypothetical protein
MAHEHLILCGSARLSSRKKVWREANTVCLELDRRRSACNVNLRVSDITHRLAANLNDLELDLLEIAAYVYSADQAVTRGGLKQIDYGRSWYRTFRFEVPVRRPDFWSSADVMANLCQTLNDVSGDNFEFAFCRLSDPPPLETYFEWGSDDITDVDEVILFSGGLDLFGGAVREALCQNRKVVLVSHRPVSKIDSRQRQLVADIAERVSQRSKAPVHVPVLVNKGKELGKDYTQRTRSFLYASLAAIVARLFGLKRIRFYETGVTSLNLPISPQVVSTRATRTTHPMVLHGYRRIFSRIIPDGFGIENPFFWKTKTEILSEIKAAGHSRHCAFTGSCAHTWQQTKMHPHCGRCSQCVERRLVALAAGYGDDEDPPEMYGLKLLTEGLDGADRILVESYFETVNKILRGLSRTRASDQPHRRFCRSGSAGDIRPLPPPCTTSRRRTGRARARRDFAATAGRAPRKLWAEHRLLEPPITYRGGDTHDGWRSRHERRPAGARRDRILDYLGRSRSP